LGTVFYEMVTARNPFTGPSYAAVLERVMNAEPEPASHVKPAVGAGLSAVISRRMEKDPAKRYPTCSDVARHMTAVQKPGVDTRVREINHADASAARRTTAV